MDAVSEDLVTAWQRIHTFDCPYGMGRLTPESCAELRNRQPLNRVGGAPHPQGRERHYRPGPCSRCAEYQRLWDEVARRRAEENQKQEEEAMGTIIDCLGCGAEDAENQGRGLCKQCYPRTPASDREHYDLKTAKRKREARLEAESTLDVGGGLLPEPAQADQEQDQGGLGLDAPEDGDPLAGYEFVPCANMMDRRFEVKVDSPGKFIRFGAQVVYELGLVPGAYVHVYVGSSGLALKFLSEPDRSAYKLSRDGSAKQGPASKVTLSARTLVRRGVVQPNQRFHVRTHDSGVLFLDVAN